jgi:Ni,Fe-hydrogenase III large subunit
MELEVPERAAYLRCAIAEVERLASHLETLSALFDALGQQRYTTIVHEVQEDARQAMTLISGSRIIPDMCLPGGLRHNLGDQQREALLSLLATINYRLARLVDRITSDHVLLARTVDIGVLARSAAEQFGLCGPLARASGLSVDTRLDHGYAAYRALTVSHIMEENGDVHARLIVLLLEACDSAKLVEQALHDLPGKRWAGSLPKELPAGQASSAVESPHGMLSYRVESDGRRLTAVAINPPPQLDRLVARTLFVGARVDDVVLIARSIDTCLACAEL